MDACVSRAQTFRGSLRVGPDKAITQRAVLVAGLASGAVELTPWSSADDCQRALAVLQALGVKTRHVGGAVHMTGGGLEGLQPPRGELFCGESGTTLRLCAGVLAGQPFRATLGAGASLRRRPMRRIVEPLSQMGARLEGAGGGGAAREEVYPPLTIVGRRPLRAITYRLPVASAQVKSAVLLAGLFAERRTTVIEPVPTRDHTERLLSQFGATVSQQGHEVAVVGGRRLNSPGRLTIPGDFSSAAFLLTAAACVPGAQLEVHDVGLNPTRTHLLTVLARMGASVQTTLRETAWEPRGIIRVEARSLRGITVEASEVPGIIDELPLVMVAACCAEGPTVLKGIGELRLKETDRIHSMVQGLQRLGAEVHVDEPDTLQITGTALRGSTVDSLGDHRTAMALAVAGLAADGSTRITGVDCVEKSFPDFFDTLRSVTSPTTATTVSSAC